MTQTIEMIDPVTGEIIDEKQIAEQLLTQAKEQGVSLVGPGGLLGGLTKTVLETALEAEMTEHLGYEKHQVTDSANARNGTRSKTVLTEVGAVEIEVPRDREGSFEPKIVRKRQRRLDGIDEIVLSLTARGLTTGEVAAHFDDVYGASVSKETISKITDKVIEEMTEWQNRVIDGAPSNAELAAAAVSAADFVLIPVQPSPYDIWAADGTVQLLRQRRALTGGDPAAGFLLSRVIPNTVLGDDVRQVLSEIEDVPLLETAIHQRQAYARLAAQGLAVSDTRASKDEAAEIRALIAEIDAALQAAPSAS